MQNVTLVGLASIAGLEVGGGPVIPEEPSAPPGDLGIWQDPGGYNPDAPGTPLPPDEPPPEREPLVEWKAAWSEETGWVIVGTPTGAHPAPSKRR